MDGEPRTAVATKTAFVYDTRTGKVVHIHQFVPYGPDGTVSEREMEATALELAPTAWDRAHLAVLHEDRQREIDPQVRYRVDVDNRELAEEPAPPDPRQGDPR